MFTHFLYLNNLNNTCYLINVTRIKWFFIIIKWS